MLIALCKPQALRTLFMSSSFFFCHSIYLELIKNLWHRHLWSRMQENLSNSGTSNDTLRAKNLDPNAGEGRQEGQRMKSNSNTRDLKNTEQTGLGGRNKRAGKELIRLEITWTDGADARQVWWEDQAGEEHRNTRGKQKARKCLKHKKNETEMTGPWQQVLPRYEQILPVA